MGALQFRFFASNDSRACKSNAVPPSGELTFAETTCIRWLECGESLEVWLECGESLEVSTGG
jgi:hypothetical protein